MRTQQVLIWTLVVLTCTGRAAWAQQPTTTADVVKLADLVAEAERKHPAILAATRLVQAKRARVPQARALPDPQLSIGYMGDPAPFKTQANDPASYRQFGVMQEFPYPGKRELRGKIAEKEVDAEGWNVEAARRRVRAEVKLAYFELWGVDRALDTTQKNKDLLEKLARIAEERYKVGKGLQQDVLRAHVEVTRVLQRLTILRQRRRTLEARLNSLLLRPPDSPFGPLEAVEKSSFAYTLDELLEKGVANAPEIRRQEQLIEQSQVAVNLAKRDYYPDFSIGWDYQNRGSGMPEMFGLRFTVNLPVFYKGKQRQALSEASFTLAATREIREAVKTTLLFQVKEQYLTARASEELLTLYAKGIVPQSMLALESALAAYQVGSLDFLSLITNFITVLDYEISYYEELANHQKALARIEEITGIELAK
ncbi:MAG TPA: TolC family protein [Candidatus Acidoferrales bacterium]|nr:TolC family protein [Candidatus Acidoferrales bacterium]